MTPLILLVDDFEDALDIYAQYLGYVGYRVVTARSGAESIEIAKARLPALILMDLRMPSMTGTEALRELRRDAALSTIPVVAFTAQVLEGERQQALLDGFDHVIAKPCLPNELVIEIRQLLAQRLRG